MGDAADQYTDDGVNALAAHENGECYDPCQYCDAEEKRSAQRRGSTGRRIADVPGRRVTRRRATDGKGKRSR